MNTTLYNHNNIGTVQKPLIPNADFKELLDEALEMHSFDPFQLQTLQHELLIQS